MTDKELNERIEKGLVLFICDWAEVRSRTFAGYYAEHGLNTDYGGIATTELILEAHEKLKSATHVIFSKDHQYQELKDHVHVPHIVLDLDDLYGIVGDKRLINTFLERVDLFLAFHGIRDCAYCHVYLPKEEVCWNRFGHGGWCKKCFKMMNDDIEARRC